MLRKQGGDLYYLAGVDRGVQCEGYVNKGSLLELNKIKIDVIKLICYLS